MIFYDVEQNTDSWHELKIGKATASNFGLIMANENKAFGEPAKKYALQLALERVNNFRQENGYTNEHMERGHIQEPIARMLYQEETFSDVMNGGFFDCHEYGCSPDGLISVDGCVEFKSVIAATHYATMKRGAPDPAYRWQLIGHLDCTNREWVDFVSYCQEFPMSKQLIVYRVYKDDCMEEIERLNERRSDFLKLVSTIYNEIRS